MSESKIEFIQGEDESSRRETLRQKSHKELNEIIYENVSGDQDIEFKKTMINFIIENNLDIK